MTILYDALSKCACSQTSTVSNSLCSVFLLLSSMHIHMAIVR